MKKILTMTFAIILILMATVPAFADDSAIISKINEILSKAADNDDYHVTARQVNEWVKAGKTDFLVLDIRVAPDDGPWGQPEYGRIPGSVFIPYSELFRPENLKKLPKDKKIVLVGHMGVHENYVVVPLRLIGFDAYALLMGMSGWQKDYPAAGHVNMLINAAQKMNFPIEKTNEGGMNNHPKAGHSHEH